MQGLIHFCATMSWAFKSVTEDGATWSGWPIGGHPAFAGFRLKDADKVMVELPKIFVLFKDKTCETSMVSLRKQAGFTITATNKAKGVTYGDVADQLPRIIRLIMDNPDVFDARTWSHFDRLVLYAVTHRAPGYFEPFVFEAYGDPAKFDFDEARRSAITAEERHHAVWAAEAERMGCTVEELKARARAAPRSDGDDDQ